MGIWCLLLKCKGTPPCFIFIFTKGINFWAFMLAFMDNHALLSLKPGRVAQLVGHLTCKSEVLSSIPGLATLLFLLPLIQEGQLSVTGKSMCTKYWLTA